MSAAKLTPTMISALRSLARGRAQIRSLTGYALKRRGLAEPFREEHAGYVGSVYAITAAGIAALAKVTT